MKAAIDATRAQRAIFPAGIDTHGMRCKVQIVRGGSGVYGGAGFQFQRGELLRGLLPSVNGLSVHIYGASLR